MSMSDHSSMDDYDDPYYDEIPFLAGDYSRMSTPAPSTSTQDKGKGKATEENDSKDSSEAKPLTEEEKKIKQKLDKAEALDVDTLQQLIGSDPTPMSSLSTSTKLAKALVLIQQTFSDSNPDIYKTTSACREGGFYGPAFLGLPLPEQPSFPLETYTTLLQLVSSALSDVAVFPMGLPAGSKESRNKSMYGLTTARARLNLEMAGHDVSGAATRPSTPASEAPSGFVLGSAADQEDKTLDKLLVENCRLTLLKLRPALLADPPARADSPSSVAMKDSPGVAYINKLPAELLTAIMKMARHLSEQRAEPAPPRFDDYGVVRPVRSSRDPRRPFDLHGSRTAGQRFAHSLALVCRTWRGPARSVAYSAIHLRRKNQLTRLLDLVSSPGQNLAQNISEINAKLPVPTPNAEMVGMTTNMRRNHRSNIYVNAAWPKNDSGSASTSTPEDVPGVMFAKLVASSASLSSLSVTVVGSPYSAPFGGRQVGPDFLEENIFGTLTSVPTLRSLTLGQCIDFEELEAIIKGLPLLQTLRLDGGFDNLDGRGNVTSSTPHEARLKSLVVGEGANYGSFSTVTDQQLSWLLEPCVETLRELALTIMSTGPGAGFPAMAVFPQNPAPTSPAFASAAFADQLARMGGTLERLTLRDFQMTGVPAPTFQAAPHNGNFDYALSQLTSLVELTIPFHYTGLGFLDSLQPSGHTIEGLIFTGTPTDTSAGELANRIEADQLPSLKRLVVSGHYVGRGINGGQGWVGSEVRRLKAIAKVKNIACLLTGGN